MDLVIEARAFVRGGLKDVEIGLDLESGTIAAVKHNLPGTPRKRYRGRLLLPSGVDWHVHFRDPGATPKEDFASGTRAAALGGVGTVLDMPNTKPLVDRKTRLEEKMDAVARKASVDWGLWATITDSTPNPEALLRSCVGLKLYLSPTTGIDASPDPALVVRALEAARTAGRWTAVHAENVVSEHAPATAREHDSQRAPEQEVAAITGLAGLAPDAAHVLIAHATTREALEAARGAGFRTAVTPHHLLLNYEARPDAWGKVNPPLRSAKNQEALLESLRNGLVDHLESDHAPHTQDEKKRGFAEAPAGVPGVETLLPLLLRRAKRGDVPLEAVVEAACQNPADDLGLPKGRIEAGKRADFFLVDPGAVERLRADRLASKCGWSPFEGFEILRPQTHYLGGEMIVEEGHFIGRAGRGRRVEPGPLPNVAPRPAVATAKDKP